MEWTGKETAMNKQEDIREKIKIIAGSIAAAFLLAFVLYMAFLSRSIAGKNESQGTLRTLQENSTYELTVFGKTVWNYLDTGNLLQGEENGLPAWTQRGYDVSAWKTGSGSFGSVKGEKKAQVDDKVPRNLLNHYLPDGLAVPVYYFRTIFEIEDKNAINSLTGKIWYDDAAVIYLNGVRVYALNVPDGGFEDSGYGAKKTVDKPVSETFVISDMSSLKEGSNVLSIEIHQDNRNSSDVYFELVSLEASGKAAVVVKPDLSGLVLEQGITEQEINVNWLTGQKGAFELWWRAKTDNETSWNYCLMGRQKTGIKGMYTYNATMKQLLPGTDYEYKIKNLSAGVFSATNSFMTGSGQEYAFAFAGDPQIGSEEVQEDKKAWNRAVEQAAAIGGKIDFLITAGDQADSSGEEEAMDEFLAFRSPLLLKSVPIAVNRGNHEASENGMDYQFPRFADNSLHDYYFTYGDTLFYALNTNSKDYDEHIKRLTDAVEKISPRWIIITMHYSMYGGTDRSQDESVMKTREAYAAAFSQLNVDLVLAGHDHLYSRSCFLDIDADAGSSSGVKEPGETMYVSGGTSTGNKFYRDRGEFPFTAFTYRDEQPTITFIHVNKERIALETRRISNGDVIDTCEIRKR